MILWINGAFGVGKTQAAWALQRRLPGAWVFDPEQTGFFLRRQTPPSLRQADFQDEPLWRAFNRDLLASLCDQYPGDLIVPMTLTCRAYYDELIAPLAARYALTHVILCASEATLRRRLASRLEGPQSWAAQQIDRCRTAFEGDLPGLRLQTDGLGIEQVAEAIAALAGRTLTPDPRRPLRRWLDQRLVQWRHWRD